MVLGIIEDADDADAGITGNVFKQVRMDMHSLGPAFESAGALKGISDVQALVSKRHLADFWSSSFM